MEKNGFKASLFHFLQPPKRQPLEDALSAGGSLGVHYGQGYYFAKPGLPKPAHTAEILAHTLLGNHRHGDRERLAG